MKSSLTALAGLAGGLWLASVAAMAKDSDLFIRPSDQHVVIFGDMDAGRSVFVSGGSKQSLTGSLAEPGFLAVETSGFGLTREKVTPESGGRGIAVDRFKHQSAILGGYQWTGPVYVAAYVGPELQEEQLAFDGRFRRFSQPRYGARGQIEIWSNPTPETLLTATVVAGTARANLWARGSAGLKVWSDIYAGPEVTFYSTATYREVRVGGHLTGTIWGPLGMRVSGGWASDDAHRSGSPYLGLSAWLRL